MIKKIIKKIGRGIKSFFKGIFWFVGDWVVYRRLLGQNSLKPKVYFFPQIFDKDPSSHTFDKHYVYMDRWAAEKIITARPAEHIDVGSSIRFLSFVSVFVPVKFVDIRPIQTDFNNFQCVAGSILNLPFKENSVKSLSCLHVAEHIGLGRYGDPLDPLGTQKACGELARVLAPGGTLYFALPIGRPATYFNAHRVHDPATILNYFSGLKLLNFAAVSDRGRFTPEANPEDYKNSRYACGMFEFARA